MKKLLFYGLFLSSFLGLFLGFHELMNFKISKKTKSNSTQLNLGFGKNLLGQYSKSNYSKTQHLFRIGLWIGKRF